VQQRHQATGGPGRERSGAARRGRGTVTLVSMMKDEGAGLLEWVAYHRLLGADRILVLTNDCSDGTDAMLDRLQALGEVIHLRNAVPPGRKPQPHALRLAETHAAVRTADWVMALDADEFLSIHAGAGRLDCLIDALPEETQACAVTWRIFGSAGRRRWTEDLVTEAFPAAAPDDFRRGWGVKTLFRPFEGMRLGIHRPWMRGARKDPDRARRLAAQPWVNGSGNRLPADFALGSWRSTRRTVGYGLAEVNHYAVKSREAYLLRRLRGNVNLKASKYDAAYFALHDRNEVSRPQIRRHLPDLRTRLAGYLADPDLARLRLRACAWAAGRLDALRAAPDYAAAMAELDAASGRPYAAVARSVTTTHLPADARARVAALRADGVAEAEIAERLAADRRTGLAPRLRRKPVAEALAAAQRAAQRAGEGAGE